MRTEALARFGPAGAAAPDMLRSRAAAAGAEITPGMCARALFKLHTTGF